MRPLTDLPLEIAARIEVVFADIDDTLTTDGRLTAAAYAALESLHRAGLKVAPITGRPAGWCDMIARFWPVDGVVGENGALYLAYDPATRSMRRAYAVSEKERRESKAALARIEERVLAEVPGCGISADQRYREADLAVDFCEDVAPMPATDVARIKAIFEEEGAVAKVSSIHVNGWFGDYDKLSMSRRFAADILGFDIDTRRDAVMFVGDSPNDAPMFAHFPHACGVANVRDFAGRLDAAPAYVASQRGGAGFAEVADLILRARHQKSERKDP